MNFIAIVFSIATMSLVRKTITLATAKGYKVKKSDTTLPQLAPAVQFIDTHCHLDMAAYGADLDQVLDRALANHIKRIVTIGIDLPSSRKAVTIAQRYRQVSATIGIHPHDVDQLKNSDYLELEQLYAEHGKHIVGFGEIGLDYFKQYSDPARQREHFKKQLELAHALRLPVIIHNREADADMLEILRAAQPLDFGGIMHCFSGDVDFAHKVLDLGMLISIPGIVTYKNATLLHQVVRQIPITSMVLETDGPFLAPHPLRGQRNESSYLLFTAHKIAELRGIDVAEVSSQTTENAENLFKFNKL